MLHINVQQTPAHTSSNFQHSSVKPTGVKNVVGQLKYMLSKMYLCMSMCAGVMNEKKLEEKKNIKLCKFYSKDDTHVSTQQCCVFAVKFEKKTARKSVKIYVQ